VILVGLGTWWVVIGSAMFHLQPPFFAVTIRGGSEPSFCNCFAAVILICYALVFVLWWFGVFRLKLLESPVQSFQWFGGGGFAASRSVCCCLWCRVLRLFVIVGSVYGDD
jgi:hypothetical protein